MSPIFDEEPLVLDHHEEQLIGKGSSRELDSGKGVGGCRALGDDIVGRLKPA